MIIREVHWQLPEIWDIPNCWSLYEHSKELAMEGNPAGAILMYQLRHFILNPQNIEEWDFDEMRLYIMDNLDRVRNVWQLRVKSL